MPLPAITGGWRFAVSMSANGWSAVATGAVLAVGGAAEDVARDVATAWAGNDGFYSVQAQDISYDGVSVQEFDGVSDAIDFDWATLDPGNNAGSLGNPTSPPGVAGIVTLRTGAHGRRGRGRLFVAGLAESMVASELGEIQASELTAWQDAANGFLNTIEGGTATTQLCVWSRADDALYGVTELAARTYLGTQRRRQDRVQNP